MPQILFVCMANRYRSVIAAAQFQAELLKRGLEKEWNVLSAGTWAHDGLSAMTDAVQRAEQIGLNIRGHRSRVVTGDMLEEADLVLVMEIGQQEALRVEFPSCRDKIFLLSEAAQGAIYDIPDPVTNRSGVDVVSEIRELIQTGFDQICTLVGR